MSDNAIALLISIVTALGTAWAVYQTSKGNERYWEVRTALGVADAKIKTLEALLEVQKESGRKSDEVYEARIKVISASLDMEKDLRRKSDQTHEAIVTGLRDQITSLTRQLEKANTELADVKHQSNSRIITLEEQVGAFLQTKTQAAAAGI